MKFLMMVRCAEDIGAPPQALMDAMGKLMEGQMKSGVLDQAVGLAPTSKGARVRSDGSKVRVIDGPFTETKEVIGGFAIMNAASHEEAVELAREFIDLHIQHWPGFVGESEVRQIEGT
jgi:hypothetical protein